MFVFDAAIWQWEAKPNTFFVSVPEDVSDEIAARSEGRERGFGSVRVRVRVGGSTWTTSVFPDDARGSYALPMKKSVRDAEALAEGSTATVELDLVD